MKQEIDKYGRLVFRNKTNNNLFAHRAYRWCDRIIVLDESNGRKVIEDTKFSTFDLTDWEPVFKIDSDRVINNYTELNN